MSVSSFLFLSIYIYIYIVCVCVCVCVRACVRACSWWDMLIIKHSMNCTVYCMCILCDSMCIMLYCLIYIIILYVYILLSSCLFPLCAQVGYPNVGKSSTINALIQSKKVPVSATPGRTKHFQVKKSQSFFFHILLVFVCLLLLMAICLLDF